MIIFHNLFYKNFLSSGDVGCSIQLDRAPTTVISGRNGQGKSQSLDAISFALFDRSYRGIKKGQLVNTINKKDALVTLEFTAGSDRYKIVRGIKPNVFEIHKNGSLIPEEAANRDYQGYLEKHVLGFNFRSFCQTCILGSANYIPFMQLSSNHRREVIESLLGIDSFTLMSLNLRGRMSEWRRNLDETSKQLELGKVKYQGLVNLIDSLNKSTEDKVHIHKTKLNSLKEEGLSLLKEIQTQMIQAADRYGKPLADVIAEQRVVTADLSEEMGKLSQQLYAISQGISKVEKNRSRIQSLDGHSECPTCQQKITEDHIETCLTEVENQLSVEYKHETDIKDQIESVRDRIMANNDLLDEMTAAQLVIDRLQTRLEAVKQEAKTVSDTIRSLTTESDIATIESATSEKDGLKLEMMALSAAKKTLLEQGEVYNVAQQLLKDSGIKSVIINQYIPILNQRVNHYLNTMNFNVKFELNSEFEETIKSRNHTDFSYANLSMGERTRVDLAILFAWRDIAALKNSVNSNLLILDEVSDSSLDGQGTDDVLSILLDVADKGSNVFVISHRANLEDKMHSTIRFEKVNGFSTIIPR